MLVRIFQSKNNNNEWDVIALSGDMYSQKIAQAEGVRLAKAKFQEYSITGFISALHGAVIEDVAYDDSTVIRLMGINGVFKECHREAVFDHQNSGWFDSESKQGVRDCQYATAMGGRVFYSLPEDIEMDRKSHKRETLPQRAGIPNSVQAPHSKLISVITCIKGAITGG